jgi:hypothetical protein
MNSNTREKRKTGNTTQYVPVLAIADSVLVVGPATPEALRGVAVIEVEGTAFHLRSEEERAALVLGYQGWLKALPPGRSVQLLIRRRPHDLSASLQQLDALATERGVPPIYRHLASAHADHLERLSSSRPLYRSRCYLIVSAAAARRPPFALPGWRSKSRQVNWQQRTHAIQDELNIQCERALAALAALGLSAHRLGDDELAHLAASCLVPARDRWGGLPDPALLALERPVMAAIEAATTGPLQALKTTTREDGYQWEHGRRIKKPGEDDSDLPLAGWPHMADVLAPSALEERPTHVFVEGEYVRSLAVVGYPREVTVGFLTPLLTHDEQIDISIHIHMHDPAVMLRRFRRRKAELRASKRLATKQGWVDNPDEQVAATDVERLLLHLASRQEMLCEVGLSIQVHADTLALLDERTERLLALLSTMLLVAHPTTFEHLVAYQTMQPFCIDRLRRTTTLDTMSVAYAFPFVSNALIMPGGVLEGVSSTGEPVIIDDWADDLDNPHRFIGAVTGAGKSYAANSR